MDIRHAFRQSFTFAQKTGVSDYGEPLFGVKQSGTCREQRKALIVVSPTGTEEQSDAQLFTLEPLEVEDRVWLPGADTTKDEQARRVLSVEHHRDLAGVLIYYLVFF